VQAAVQSTAFRFPACSASCTCATSACPCPVEDPQPLPCKTATPTATGRVTAQQPTAHSARGQRCFRLGDCTRLSSGKSCCLTTLHGNCWLAQQAHSRFRRVDSTTFHAVWKLTCSPLPLKHTCWASGVGSSGELENFDGSARAVLISTYPMQCLYE
jgi:hypothetical protein